MTIDSAALNRATKSLRGYRPGFKNAQQHHDDAHATLSRLALVARDEGNTADEDVLRQALALLALGHEDAAAIETLLTAYQNSNR